MSKKKKGKSDEAATGRRVIDVNKKARRDYEILDTLEAGIVLNGSEVKSIRSGGINLRDSYVRLKGNECFLIDCHVSPYAFSRKEEHDPYRDRKLLLHRKEIMRFSAQVQQKGLTLVPIKVYFDARGRCKLEVGVARGKKLFDKRQDLKTREAQREMERAFK